MHDSKVAVGLAAIPVDIAVPVSMSGFAARTAKSTGTGHPKPRASAVAIEDVTLVILDVIGVDKELANAVRERTGLDRHITVAATHTHAGPCVVQKGLGSLSPEAFEYWVSAGAEAAKVARAVQQQADIEWMDPFVAGVATNRRRGRVSEDAVLSALRFTGVDGEVIGVLTSYPCHPTSLGPLNGQLSGDYPGFLRTTVEDAWGGSCVFATGCAGDINTGHSATASYTLGGGDAGRTMEDARRVGAQLGDSLIHGEWSKVDLSAGVRWLSAAVTLDQVPLESDDPATLAKRWEAERLDSDPGVTALLDGWISWAREPSAGSRGQWTGRVGRLDIGEISIFLLPGEPFLDADLALRRSLPGKTIALGYWEDCPGYLPSAKEYARGGYEVVDAHRYYGMPAPFAVGSLELIVDTVLTLGSTPDEV